MIIDISDLKKRLYELLNHIEKICIKSNRDMTSLKILLATKTVDIVTIQAAINLGFGMIGENKVQDLSAKIPLLKDIPDTQDIPEKIKEIKYIQTISPRENHFIGHLQTNKIKNAALYSDCIQSVDRLSLACKLNEFCHSIGKIQNILIQVNTSYENTKKGIAPDKLFSFLAEMKAMNMNNLFIQGFMTLGLNQTNQTNKSEISKGFSLLRELNEEAINIGLIPSSANILSMGMSNDFDVAIQEGSNLLRIGSLVFGSHSANTSF